MKRFREFITEDPNQQRLQTDKGEGIVDIENESVREDINALLIRATACPSLTPYIALYKIMKVLAGFHIHLPQTMLSGERGHKIYDINQFGLKTGMKDDGKVVTADQSEYKLYFEYEMNDRGMFDVYCEIIDGQELDEIQDDIDLEEQTVFEALSSFGRAYRNARTSNQGTFNWRGKSYDSELKSRPVQSTARPQPSPNVPLPRPGPRADVDRKVLGPPQPDAGDEKDQRALQQRSEGPKLASKSGPNSTTTNATGPQSTTTADGAGSNSTVAGGPPIPKPRPLPSSVPDIPVPRPAPSPNLDAEANKAKEAQKNDITAGSGRLDQQTPDVKPDPVQTNKNQVAVKEEMLSETDSKFTRMLKQRRG